MRATDQNAWLVGVDGCAGGWIAAFVRPQGGDASVRIVSGFADVLTAPERPAIVESILALGRTMNTSVVAEGIESEVQWRELERLGCTRAQGYLFSRPVSAAAAEQILAAREPLGPKRQEAPVKTESPWSGLGTPFEWPEVVAVSRDAQPAMR